MKRVLAAVAAVAMTVGVVPAASAAEGIELTGIRTGKHVGFDRVVFDLAGPRPEVVHGRAGSLEHCGSGKPIDALGAEFVVVSMRGANAHNYQGPRAFEPKGLGTVVSVSNTCDFEGHLDFGIGHRRAGAGYSVSFLDNPTRVVIDIKH